MSFNLHNEGKIPWNLLNEALDFQLNPKVINDEKNIRKKIFL